MTDPANNSHRLLLISMIFTGLLLVTGAFFAIRTQGFGYFVTPTVTITPTSTIQYYGRNPKPTSSITPFQPMPTDTPTPTSTFTPTATSTPTPTVTPWPTSTPIPPTSSNIMEDGLPTTYRITGITAHDQTHSLSCESRTAVDWAGFYGVSISENTFQAALPVSDNPEKGFVGNVNGTQGLIPPNDYGVHAEPVAALLRSYGVSATASKWISLSDLRRQITSGNPVIVWVVGNVQWGSPVAYTASDGSTTTVAYNEHTVMLVGYDESGFYFVDGSSTYWRSIATFTSSFGALNNMSITH